MHPPTRSRRALLASAGLALVLVACSDATSSSGSKATSSSTRAASGSSTTSTPRPDPNPTVTVTLVPWRLSRPSARAAVVADGRGFLVLGGFDGAKQTTAQVLRVDPTTGATTNAGTLAQAVHDVAGALVGGAPMVFGGGNTSESSAVQRFVPGATATLTGRLPVPRSDLGAVTVGDRAYLVGGYDDSSVRASALSTGDGAAFAVLGDLPVPVRYPAVAASGTDVVVIGGTRNAYDSAAGDTAAVQVLDTRTGAVRLAGQLPKTLSHAVAATVRGQIYVFGGRWGGVPTAQVWHWDVTTSALVPVGTMTAAVTDGAAVTVGDSAYYVGGEAPNPTAAVSELRVR
ncbi:MAG: hypothetical protein ACXVJW_02245 [Acidimicrobiia bacterium]